LWHPGHNIKPWEYWLGDKAYVGCPEFLTEFKKPIGGQLNAEQIEWNLLLQHYRRPPGQELPPGLAKTALGWGWAASSYTCANGTRQAGATSTWCRP